MAKERVLITVKTYPTLSKKYIELVCTAGFREDGSWIRIYPSPFRFLDDAQRYKKYQWVELDLEKNPKDIRPESYRPINIDDIKLYNWVGTGKGDWAERRRLILERNKVYTNLNEIIQGAKRNEFSLVIFKPQKILEFIHKTTESDWELSQKEAAEAALKQGSLFDESKHIDFKLMPKLPYKFSYKFTDDEGRESTMMIEDWEIGQLYWNVLKKSEPEEAVQKVRAKYFDDFARTKDLHLFLGTTLRWHQRAPNPYVIIGTFHPPIETQPRLF